MKAVFDLDGSLYDSLPPILKVSNAIHTELGYQKVSAVDYQLHFQTKDWHQFYRDLGIKEEHLDYVIAEFPQRFSLLEPPQLIPKAKEILQEAEETLGPENIYIITNETLAGVQKRFERDDLTKFLDRIKNPFQGKAQELYQLAKNSSDLVYYIGDLVSDGEECFVARNRGAENLQFCGLVHQYAMNLETAMRNFVNAHPDFSQVFNDLNELRRLWS